MYSLIVESLIAMQVWVLCKSSILRSSHFRRPLTIYIIRHSLNAGVRNLFWQRGSEIGDKIDVNSHLARSSRRWLLPGGLLLASPSLSYSSHHHMPFSYFLSPSFSLSLSPPCKLHGTMLPFCEEKRARIRIRKKRWCRTKATRGNGGRLLHEGNGGGRAGGR